MKVDGRVYRTIRPTPDGTAIEVMNQTHVAAPLRHAEIEDLDRRGRRHQVDGGARRPLIGATAAYGLAMALRRSASDDALRAAYRALLASRPTAVNLRHACDIRT